MDSIVPCHICVVTKAEVRSMELMCSLEATRLFSGEQPSVFKAKPLEKVNYQKRSTNEEGLALCRSPQL